VHGYILPRAQQFSKSPLVLLILGHGIKINIMHYKYQNFPLIQPQKPLVKTVGQVEFW